MSLELKNIVQKEIRSGESVLWVGRPNSMPLNAMGIMGTAMGGLFCIIGTLVFIGALFSGVVFAAVFMAIWTSIAAWNLYIFSGMLFGPRKQIYAITNKRGIIIENFRKDRVATINPAMISSYEIERHGEEATLRFGEKRGMFFMTMSPNLPLDTFHRVTDYKNLENLIHCTFAKDG